MSRTFYVAGIRFHDLPKVIPSLEEGMELDIEPDLGNPYDPNAVKITFNGTMLGFVPRRLSAEVSSLFELGARVRCKITKLNPSAKPWEQLEVNVSFEGEESEEGGEEE